MAQKRETYEKVAETFQKKGNAAWSDAKSGNEESYAAAKKFYDTAQNAREKAEQLRKGK